MVNCSLEVDFQSNLKPKYDTLFYVVIIILWGKIKITTNYKISYFGFYFDWKSTLNLLNKVDISATPPLQLSKRIDDKLILQPYLVYKDYVILRNNAI